MFACGNNFSVASEYSNLLEITGLLTESIVRGLSLQELKVPRLTTEIR